ncbi:MAG: hypothetical protein M9962_01280 [Oligoflexia bacterium]|nr:hypothetical protein [Oligoflexia bacterium]
MKTKILLHLSYVSLSLVFCFEAYGFGSKPKEPTQTQPTTPTISQAKPFRYVELAHVTVPTFFFANGDRADFNTDLPALIETEINGSNYFRTQLSSPEHAPRLIISGGITSLEMDVLQLNMKIGWNPSGAIIPTQFANGELDFRLSSLSMDFKIYDRVTKQTYMTSYTNEKLSKLNITAKVNVSNITGSLDILYKTQMAKAIRIAMNDIMKNLENNRSFDYLPWEARVVGVDLDNNFIAFNSGQISGVKQNSQFSVYSSCAVNDQSCFSRFLADVKVIRVGPNSAEATPASDKNSIQKVQTGDLVYVKILN